jgi:Trypsin-like peptidase domain/Tetratricopeptide repeat
MGVDRYRVCELYATGPSGEGSGSGYRLGDRLVLTARHVIAPALARAGGQVLVRQVGVTRWLPAQVKWQDADADAALIGVEDEDFRAPTGESVLRWGELASSDPLPCAAVGFPWASARPDRMRDTAHVYGQLAPLGQLRQGRLDLDVASASPSAREGGSPWAGMSGAGVITDNHLVGVITVDPARYRGRLVAVPVGRLLADPGFRARLVGHGVPAEAAPVGAGWYLCLPGGQTVSLAPAYRPASHRLRPTPSTLLRPEHGLVPFLGRQPLLDRITGWCQDPATDRPLLLVVGGGGSGKTRLGREACVQMLVAGWDAGLADDKRREGTAATRLQRPALLVVDDADLRTGLISGLLDYLRWDDAGPPVRLLLLARAAGDWWDRLVRQQELANSYTVLDLDQHPIPLSDRLEHFRRASTAFAAYGGPEARSVDPPPTAELNDPAYAEPLLIHIAALLRTVDTSATPPPLLLLGEDHAPDEDIRSREPGPPVRQTLLQALCERERTRWYQLGQESHLSFNPDLPLVDQVVALATLTAATDQPWATSLLAALPNQAEVTRIGAEALVVWAHRLYSGLGYWNPLRPDLLAEQHLADTAQLSVLAATAAQLAAGQRWETGLLTQLLAELTRGAPNQPVVRVALNTLLAAALPRIVHLAVTAGRAELADLASLALQLAPQPDLAAPLADQMPEHSVQLAALAATLTSQQVTYYRTGTIDGQPDTVIRLAGSLDNLSARLASLGRREDALAASEEAVTIGRELAAARPDAFRPDLAASLNNLSADMADLDRVEDALATIEEATGIYRELAGARPDAFRPDLARSLNNLAVRLAALGRREDALAAIEEATGIYRELAAARPDAFRPDLAASLNNLAARLAGLDRVEDALAVIEEAVTIRRELAGARPDAFRPDLARSLDNLALGLAALGRREDALAADEEATGIYRELAAARPDAFRPHLAKSLDNLAAWLAGQGRWEDALAASEESTGIYRELAAARPDAFRPHLAKSLSILAARMRGLGRVMDARAADEEAVTIYRELAGARPDAFRPDLAWSLDNLALGLAGLGRVMEALAASEEAVTVYRELAGARPDAFWPDLAWSLDNLSARLAGHGRREDALAASEESTGIYRELAGARPDAFRLDLAWSLDNLSARLAGLDRAEDALAASEEFHRIYRELDAAHLDVLPPDLAWSQAGLGRAMDARAADEEAFAIGPEQLAYRSESDQSLRVVHVHPRFHPSPAWLENSEDRGDASRGGLSK